MSFFSKRFGFSKKAQKGSTSSTSQTSEAILKLKDSEEILTKKQEFLESKVQQELLIAKKNGKTNKRVALQALKRKKRYEQQLQQIDGTLTTLEQQRETLESSAINTTVFYNMDVAAKALRRNNNNLDINQVEEMINEIKEQQEFSREIAEAISSPDAFGPEFDEDDLEAELKALESEELGFESYGDLNSTLPNVPSSNPKQNVSSTTHRSRELAS